MNISKIILVIITTLLVNSTALGKGKRRNATNLKDERLSSCHTLDLIAKSISKELHPRRRSRYQGCQKDMEWMKKVRSTFCKSGVSESDIGVTNDTFDQLEIPQIFFFTFDGAADFNAEKALEADSEIVNLSGDELSDLYIGNFNGGREILPQIAHFRSFYKIESRYYAGSGLQITEGYHRAFKCIRNIDKYLDIIESHNLPNYRKPYFVTTGYSNGGVNVLALQNEMPSGLDRATDIVLTIDPIAQANKYHSSKLFTYAGKKNDRTGKLFNFYQDIDYGSLPLFYFKGKPVENADMNVYVDGKNNKTIDYYDGKYAHIAIPRTPLIWSTLSDAIHNLFHEF